MAAAELELRVMALEAEMTRMKKQLEKTTGSQKDWLDAIYGAFANDPHFEEAMRLGREYRESLRPKAVKKTARKTTKKAGNKSLWVPSTFRAFDSVGTYLMSTLDALD